MRRSLLTSRRLLVASAVAAAIALALIGSRRLSMPGDARASSFERAAPVAGGARRLPAPSAGGPERLAVPELGGNPEGEFVRQRHDYPPDTPERLGPKIGRVLFDLETVVDMVSRGHLPDSEIATALGRPLAADNQKAAQQVLQEFFDQATPVVDAVLVGELTTDAGFERLLEQRVALNCRLMGALAFDEVQLLTLWPQMQGLIDEGCSGRTDKPEADVVPRQLQGR